MKHFELAYSAVQYKNEREMQNTTQMESNNKGKQFKQGTRREEKNPQSQLRVSK